MLEKELTQSLHVGLAGLTQQPAYSLVHEIFGVCKMLARQPVYPV